MPQDLVVIQTQAVAKCVSCLCSTVTEGSLKPEYVPTFRFGSLSAVEVVTISLNPAENVAGYRSLPRLADFQRTSRLELDDQDLTAIQLRSDEYFSHRDRHRFFDSLEKIVQAINPKWTYERSGKVAHIDVVACVTRKPWSKLHPNRTQLALIQATLIDNCRPHFLNTLRMLPSPCYLLCNGSTAMKAVEEVGASIECEDVVGNSRIFVGTLTLNGRSSRLAAWNRPAGRLGRPEEIGDAVKRLMKWKWGI
jgi:hypothetical protein